MKIHCLGGFREVGRNAVLVEHGRERILLDYGVVPQEGLTPLPPGQISSLLLAHPHLDHSGCIPMLYKKQTFVSYTTAATGDQAELLLRDSLKLMKLKGKRMLFTKAELAKFSSHKSIVTFGQVFETAGCTVEVIDAGHVPGSCCYVLDFGKLRLLYTSDFNTLPTRLLNGADISKFKDIDIAIMESTYAAREHPPRAQTERAFLEAIKETLERGGIALVPVFAVGRAAEILLVLFSTKLGYPVYLDGMAKAATAIALRYPELLRNPSALRAALERTQEVSTDEERTKLLKEPCVIVTTSGMCEGGPVVWYIKRLYTRSDCSINFTGYQAPKTAGRYLLDTGRFVTAEFDLALKMAINYFDFSAHAGRSQLLEFVQKVRPRDVICMHGDYCERFATELRGRFAVRAIAPRNGDVISYD